jgi:hypothetical protein
MSPTSYRRVYCSRQDTGHYTSRKERSGRTNVKSTVCKRYTVSVAGQLTSVWNAEDSERRRVAFKHNVVGLNKNPVS